MIISWSRKEDQHWERRRISHEKYQMERTKFKGPWIKKRLNMKGSKRKKRGSGICKEDQKRQAHVKSMRRGSRAPSACKENWKHQVHMNKVQRGSKALGTRESAQQGSLTPNTHRMCVVRINNTRHMWRVCNKNQQHLACIEHT
jgi:hypothetical protein